ncbi:MAG TPA: bifunctional diguanylate cyclase/phosphodiesterase [Solirubrobacterales bacterium]|nr:bifunctional diguanylate cyclase/phosphodiesterase [Solirubrobacterales bacterium]
MGRGTQQRRPGEAPEGFQAESWTTRQLAEFLSVVSAFTDERAALQGCVERAAAAIGADVAVLIREGRVAASIGFPQEEKPVADVVEASGDLRFERVLGDLGTCTGICSLVGEEGTLLVARIGLIDFSKEELDLLRGMGRVLALALRSIRLIGELRERQTLLERLTLLQRSIASRADIEDVLNAIVTGASELLGDEMVDLSLIDPEDPTVLEIVASVGYPPELLDQIRRTPVEIGVAGHAVTQRRPIVVEDYGADPRRMPDVVVDGLRAVISAPVYQRGELVGALSLGTREAGRRYSEIERDAVLAFAEHAGLALNDAKAAAETAHQAFHDPLTGLANRALFVDRLAQSRIRAAAAGDAVGVLFADLDGFKTVNDSLGHAAGDQLLIIAGQRLASVVGATDTVARFGGDEFAILVEDVRQPIELARMARQALSSLERVVEVEGREVFITASIGIAVGLEEPSDLLRNADLAMYEAKGQGKGRYEIFQRHMHEALAQRLDLELDLKRAADREEFVLHFQPIVEIDSAAVVGVEALIRWMHPTQGLILPDRFIPIAEESGQIHALGRWVLWEACRQVVEWEDTHGELRLNVNISGAQLRQASLVREVAEILEATGLEPERLTLEVTESVLMEVSSSNTERLDALKKIGVQLAVDDFGTGYSSLQYLKRLPFDWLKIAKPFVDGVGDSDAQARIARAIVDLAHSLEIEVVAEGIESRRQAVALGELGCFNGQGFHFSPPLPAGEISAHLGASPAAR